MAASLISLLMAALEARGRDEEGEAQVCLLT